MKGKFILFEGLGGSGKSTQAKKLCEKLESGGISHEYLHFPVYTTPSGEKIRKYLGGELKYSMEDISRIYSDNRYEQKEWIINTLNKGTHIVCDRYYPSNIAFQAAKYEDEIVRRQKMSWLKEIDSKLPEPDMTIMLDVPVNTSQEMLDNRGNKDIHEQDILYQERIRQIFLELAERNDWKMINCYNNGLRSVEEIHKEVWEYVEKII